MAKRALDLAKVIFEAEPDAALGDPEAVERVSQALAKINGAILATVLVRHGEDALADAMQSIAKTVELEARRTASMVQALEDDSGDPPESVH
jgi:ABC-type polar amino acid transport system ATPase subunit